jgi:magnesium chelatase subunit H
MGASDGGLGPVETTMLIALPEIDGATNPTVFGGRHGRGLQRVLLQLPAASSDTKAMAPCLERIDSLVEKTPRLALLRRKANAEKKVGIVLFGFPPNAGAVGTAAYLRSSRACSTRCTRMKADGYDVEVPASSRTNCATRCCKATPSNTGRRPMSRPMWMPTTIVRNTPPAEGDRKRLGPGAGQDPVGRARRVRAGPHFGNVFVGVQPTFGYEGDPMRLLFEKGFAPTHAFTQFYMWLKNTYQAADAAAFRHAWRAGIHARQAGGPWRARLARPADRRVPNVYLYASNNPSEATLAKRRSNAVTVTHLTPPLAASGLYKGLAELKDSA